MKRNLKLLLIVLAIPFMAWAAYRVWHPGSGPTTATHERRVSYYQDSMHPWIKSSQPGKCTVCGMDLTPIFEGDKGFGGQDNLLVLSSNNITVLNVQTESVRKRSLRRTLQVAGTLEVNEARKTIIAAPSPGRIQSSTVDYPGMEVEKGQTLVSLFSPELVQRRAYLRSVGGEQSSVGQGLLQAAQDANPYLGNLLAPLSGVVVERNVYPGQYVVEGEKLFTIVDASVVWFRFDVYEQQLPWLKPGLSLEVTTAAVPGSKFPAVISFIEPTLNDATRTVRVRAEIQNPVVATNGHPQRLLRFGMYAEGQVRTEIPDVLAVPRAAVLLVGSSAYAYVDRGQGAYQRRRLQLGRQGDDLWEVRQGLAADERVVTSGNVLIDAQAQFNQGDMPDATAADEITAAEPSSPPPLESTVSHVGHAASTASSGALASPVGRITPSQQAALDQFLKAAAALSQTLAADDLKQTQARAAALPGLLASLCQAVGDDHPWSGLLKPLQASARWPVPADLAAARKTFLPFSTQVVALVEHLRAQDACFASLKVYHCPMAPKPGLWFQAAGPLRNPFYGSEMLTCGEEVLAPAVGPKPVAANPQVAAQPPRPDATPHRASTPPPASAQAATDSVPPAHPSVGHSRVVGALMSPGEELQTVRRATILKALQEEKAMQRPLDPAAQRAAARQQALRAFTDVADGIGQALAADDFSRFYERITALTTTFSLLRQEFGTNHPWHGLIQQVIKDGLPLASAGQWRTTKDLAGARKIFVPFGAATAELAKTLRKEDQAFAGLKIYYCPMAPKPGLWMQTQAPLKNPFFGAKMLSCGEEVLSPSSVSSTNAQALGEAVPAKPPALSE